MSSRKQRTATAPAVPQKSRSPLASALESDPSIAASSPSWLTYYLVAYNILTTLAWSYILLLTSLHLAGFTPASKVLPAQPASIFVRLASSLPYFKSWAAQSQSRVPPYLLPLLNRAKTTFDAVGQQTTLVQSMALLEVIHVALGWVRSSLVTTAMQVASRLALVLLITPYFESARASPWIASMILSWSITEVIRYPFYAAGLLSIDIKPLIWLRYTTFYLLYPTGASSEAFVMFATLPPFPPPSSPLLSAITWFRTTWGFFDYGRAVLFLIWWPSLYVLYNHMIKQRAKVFGGRKLKEQ